MIISTLHPDDVLFFNEVRTAMTRVARNYSLPLRSIESLPMPRSGMADRLGQCSHSGDIHLVMRCTVNGEWCDAPLSPDNVWETAAHELAHLRHMNHGQDHQEFTLELFQALNNQQKDHREKVIDKLVKLQAQAHGEAELGNTAAAEAFAGAVNRMLIEYELNPSDIDYARVQQNDPIMEVHVDLAKYRIEKVQRRIAWQESLARVVAKAHLCTFLLRPKSNDIWFVGTRSHVTVAEYVYGVLVPAAFKMSEQARRDFRNDCRRACNYTKMDGFQEAYGYREAWLNAFVERISERMQEVRAAAVKQASADVPGGESTALIRLDGAMVRVQKYIDDKFASRRRRSVSALSPRGAYNTAGRTAGRAAADRMPIGTRGLTGGAGVKGLLK